MKIFLAAFASRTDLLFKYKPKYILESFYYINNKIIEYSKSNYCKEFLLDSGAFTYLNTGKKVDFDKYVEKYAKFIHDNKFKLYFEMDIDKIVGLEKVEEYRKYLEKETKTKCIPVFHKSRGKDYFEYLVKNYKYIAIGGIAIKDIKKSEYKYFDYFIKKSYENDCKIHGLGFTSLKELNKYKFDSVDSTSWKHGEISSNLYIFKNNYLQQIKKEKNLIRKVNCKQMSEHNINEWIKFANYAERRM